MARTQREWARPPQVAAPDYVSNLIYTDPAIFDDEREHIARKTWKFACHESEIPAPGDYRTFDHAGCPLIAARGDDGVVRTFVNACSHRAARILREPRGNARNWTCLFHHWTYDNRGACIAIPREEGFAASGVAKEDAGLREVRTAVRLGMVFVNLDDDAPSFDAYVGDALENVADVMGGPEELEVFHIYRHLTHTNWKQLQEVQMELYHEYLHFVNRQVAMGAAGYHDRKWRIYPNGHATLDPMRQRYENVKGWKERAEKTLPGLGPGEFRIVDLFPDTCIVVRTTVMRIDTMVPLGPARTLLESRGLAIKGEPEAGPGHARQAPQPVLGAVRPQLPRGRARARSGDGDDQGRRRAVEPVRAPRGRPCPGRRAGARLLPRVGPAYRPLRQRSAAPRRRRRIGESAVIEIYSWPTPNCHKVHIMLEETGLAHDTVPVNIMTGAQFEPDFLKISPNNKVPAIVDRDGPGGEPLALSDSGAILLYLAEKTGRLMPAAGAARYAVLQWLMFQMAHVGPMFGQAHHFRKFAGAGDREPYAVQRYTSESGRLYNVMDRQLRDREFLAGGLFHRRHRRLSLGHVPRLSGPEPRRFPRGRALVRHRGRAPRGAGGAQGPRRRGGRIARRRRRARDPVRPRPVRAPLSAARALPRRERARAAQAGCASPIAASASRCCRPRPPARPPGSR